MMKKIITYLLPSIIVVFISHASCFARQSESEDRGYIVKTGEIAPDFSFVDINGKQSKLSDYRGKVLMLQFTASWCKVCIKEMPHIESEIYQPNKADTNFVLMAFALKEDTSKINVLRKATSVTYSILPDLDGNAFFSFAKKDAGVTRNVIIDKNGRIVFLTRLYDENEFAEMKKIIQELLKK